MSRFALLLVVSLFGLSITASAADWPQWRGPNRDDISSETGLLKTWPEGGPKLLWESKDAGIGYSGPAVVGDRLYIMGAFGDTEKVYAVDVKNGEKLWATEIGSLLTNNWGDGPRGTPTVDGEVLYVISAQGNLVCVETAGGKKRWSRSIVKDLGGSKPNWGYTESPLVDGDKVLCTPGGSRGTIAALNKKTGDLIWQSKEVTYPAHYASIIVADVGGVRQYVQLTPKGVIGVAAADGRLLWEIHEGSNGTATIPTPIFHDDHVYVTSDYGTGCALIKLVASGEGIKAEKVYANKNMENHHGGVVLLDGKLYGCSGNAPTKWVCQDFKTGEVVWQEPKKLDKGSLTYADGHFYCYGQKDGTVVLLRASPEGWKEDGRFKIPHETKVARKSGHIWTHPVVANGRLYLRDEDLLYCFDIKDPGVSTP